jgi:hypothetical protein
MAVWQKTQRGAEYCDAHGYRCFVERTRWSPHPLQNDQRDEWEGFLNSIRIGAWRDIDEAKRETLAMAQLRTANKYNSR